jgi:hypothetical protein
MTKLNANQENYLATLGIPPPPPITPDMAPAAQAWIEMATAALVEAANMGDPADYAQAEKGHAERAALATDAASRFPANEEQQAQGMDQTMQMAQQLPQMASGVAGALTGALGGIMQPLMQIPQQLAQTGQQLLQTGMGALQQNGGLGDDLYSDEWGVDGLGDLGSGGGGAGDIGAGGGGAGAGGGGGGGIGTTPMSMLGPPATPSASTAPTGAGRAVAPIAPVEAAPARAPMGPAGPMPMMPPGMAQGAGGDRDDKTDKKRISVPAVKNGAPVQGRITAAPPAPVVTKSGDGAKAEVVRRRIVVPSDKATEKPAEQRDNPPKD